MKGFSFCFLLGGNLPGAWLCCGKNNNNVFLLKLKVDGFFFWLLCVKNEAQNEKKT